ncbi:MAG: rhomboid family intramembrane serine protease [Planctomycetota bacterium]|jgi:membrane associated rhomboid family serine protease
MGTTGKICAICGECCADRPRVKDARGHYYCKSCHDAALAQKRARQAAPAPPEPEPAPPPEPGEPEDDPYAIMPEIFDPPAAPVEPQPEPVATGSCPSCDHPLPADAQICVHCGVNVRTGRSVVTSRGLDENKVHDTTERVIRPLSWLSPIGFCPVASEAMGRRRPYSTWAIALLTALVTLWFWFSTGSQMQSRKNLMLWAGQASPSAELIRQNYEWTNWGDPLALEMKMRRLAMDGDYDTNTEWGMDELFVAAHESLPPRKQAIGQFRGYQLLTHALLHADIFHLLGNLVFLLIFGSRVNALVGSIGVAVLYPILAVLAALAFLPSVWDGEPVPMLGASGAIMALAGMYLVLYPVNRMHMVAWFRFLFFFRMKIWTVRGFWVVLFYVAIDGLYVSAGADTGVPARRPR